MFDELFEMFERDREPARPGERREERRGIRGFFSRMFGGGEDSDRRGTHRSGDDRDNRYDDEQPSRYRFGDEDDSRSRRRDRERDSFDFGDD